MDVLELDRKQSDLLELFSAEELATKVKELAEQINKDYPQDETLYVVPVLKGSAPFAMDLIRHLTMPVQLEFVRLASYGNEQTSGKMKAVDLTLPNLNGKNVLVVEDIIDTGNTAKFFLAYLEYHHKAKKTAFMALLDKKCKREAPVEADYSGFEVDDKFVVGYGLDYMGYYRNLPYIGYFPE